MKSIFLSLIFISALNTVSYSQSSDSTLVYYNQGIAENEARRFREAEKNFKKALELDANHLESAIELAKALLKQNRYADAWKAFEHAEKLAPEHPEVVSNLATLSFNMRRFDDAIAYAQKMQHLKLEGQANYMLGKSYIAQENYGKGLQYLQLAAGEDEKNADIYYTMAKAYADMSNYRKSAELFEKAIALDDTKPYWIYEASLIFYAIPDYKKSLEYMELAGEKGLVKNNNYLENLGNAYLNANQYDKAIATLKEVLERKPMDQELLYQVAQANYKAGNYKDAIAYWDQVLANDTTNARALYMIGLSYQKSGDKQKGQHLCDAAIKLDPSLSNLRQKQEGMGF